jgi:hypothetical protein
LLVASLSALESSPEGCFVSCCRCCSGPCAPVLCSLVLPLCFSLVFWVSSIVFLSENPHRCTSGCAFPVYACCAYRFWYTSETCQWRRDKTWQQVVCWWVRSLQMRVYFSSVIKCSKRDCRARSEGSRSIMPHHSLAWTWRFLDTARTCAISSPTLVELLAPIRSASSIAPRMRAPLIQGPNTTTTRNNNSQRRHRPRGCRLSTRRDRTSPLTSPCPSSSPSFLHRVAIHG